MAQLASLRVEVGAFLCSEALTHAFDKVGGEEEHPWHHFGPWVEGVEELQLKSKAVGLCWNWQRKEGLERHKKTAGEGVEWGEPLVREQM